MQQSFSSLQDQPLGGHCLSGGGSWGDGGPPRGRQQSFFGYLRHDEFKHPYTWKLRCSPELVTLAIGRTTGTKIASLPSMIISTTRGRRRRRRRIVRAVFAK